MGRDILDLLSGSELREAFREERRMRVEATERLSDIAAALNAKDAEIERQKHSSIDKIIDMDERRIDALLRLQGRDPQDVATLGAQAIKLAIAEAEIEQLKAGHLVDIVFDGPPGPTAGRFVEAENDKRASIRIGDWILRDDGYWVLRIRVAGQPEANANTEDSG